MTGESGKGLVRYLATSMAGHDRGSVYAVVGEEENFLFLTDGVHHKLSKPKKKNRKHVQVIRHLSEAVRREAKEAETDSQIIRLLREYALEMRGEADACQNLMS